MKSAAFFTRHRDLPPEGPGEAADVLQTRAARLVRSAARVAYHVPHAGRIARLLGDGVTGGGEAEQRKAERESAARRRYPDGIACLLSVVAPA